MQRYDWEIFGFDSDGKAMAGFACLLHCKRPAWTPRQVKKFMRRDGAVSFKRDKVPSNAH